MHIFILEPLGSRKSGPTCRTLRLELGPRIVHLVECAQPSELSRSADQHLKLTLKLFKILLSALKAPGVIKSLGPVPGENRLLVASIASEGDALAFMKDVVLQIDDACEFSLWRLASEGAGDALLGFTDHCLGRVVVFRSLIGGVRGDAILGEAVI